MNRYQSFIALVLVAMTSALINCLLLLLCYRLLVPPLKDECSGRQLQVLTAEEVIIPILLRSGAHSEHQSLGISRPGRRFPTSSNTARTSHRSRAQPLLPGRQSHSQAVRPATR